MEIVCLIRLISYLIISFQNKPLAPVDPLIQQQERLFLDFWSNYLMSGTRELARKVLDDYFVHSVGKWPGFYI